MKPNKFLRRFLATAGSVTLATSSAHATLLYWDSNGATAGAGGTPTGTWGTSAFWNDNSTGGAGTFTSITSASDDLYFVAGPASNSGNGNTTITVTGTQAANSLNFQHSGGFTFNGGTVDLGTGGISIGEFAYGSTAQGSVTFGSALTLNLTGAQSWTNNSANVFILSNTILTGSANLTTTGTGRISILRSNTGFSGNVLVSGGELEARTNVTNVAGSFGTGNLEINGGIVGLYFGNTLTRALGSAAGEIRITGGVSGFSGNGNSGSTFTVTNGVNPIQWGDANFNATEFVLQRSTANANGKGTFASAIDLNGADRTIRSDQSAVDLANGYGTFSGNLTNSSGTAAGLIKTGTGHHILSGTNTYDGGTTINQGILTFQKIAAMPSSGNVQVNDGAILGIRVGGAGNWTNGTSGVGTLGGLLAGVGGAGTSTVGYTGNVGVLLDMAANTTYSGNIANVGTTLALYKIGGSSLTLSGNNSYTGGTTLSAGTLIADSATALGSGDITFKGGTLQYTTNSAATDFGSQFANSTSAMLLNTNGQNVGISGIANTNTGGLTKSGTGILTLSGTNSYTGTTTIAGGSIEIDGGTTSSGAVTFTAANTSMTIKNGGTLNSTGNSDIGVSSVSGNSVSVLGGSGGTSTWNLGNSLLTLQGYAPPQSNKDLTIDGAGVAASAVVTNIQDLQWGRSAYNSDLLVTNGGRLNVNRDVQIGSTYYGETGINNTITIQGGTANSIMTVGQDYYIGYGDRAAASSNSTTVGAGGQLTITRDMYVGHVGNIANSDNPATANQLTVTGGGTASMRQLSLGYAAADGRDAPANVVEVTSGGQLSTSGVAYIGRANNATSTSNANTMTVSGTGSSWNAGNQNVYVGHTNNATAQSNNNILTVGAGASVTNVNSLVVGFGTGTETGNQLVVNGSISVTTLTVSTGNTLSGSGTINGAVTVNGTLSPGNSPGQLTIANSLTLGTTSNTVMELGGTTLGLNYDNITLDTLATALTYGGDLNVINFGLFDMDASSFTYDLFSLGSVTPTGDFNSVTVNSVSLTNTLGVWTGANGGVSYEFDQAVGNLAIVVVPEPGAVLIGSLGLLLLLRRRRN